MVWLGDSSGSPLRPCPASRFEAFSASNRIRSEDWISVEWQDLIQTRESNRSKFRAPRDSVENRSCRRIRSMERRGPRWPAEKSWPRSNQPSSSS